MSVSKAQVADYDEQSINEVVFHHLQLTMELQPSDSTLRGVAAWQFSVDQASTPEIRLNAIRTEVYTVLINERDADYFMSGDTLIVTPFQELTAGTRYKLEIIYRSEPSFGVQRKASGAFMSSMIPGAVANLLPVSLSARIQVPLDIRMIVPSDWQSVANGVKTANILLPEGRRLYHWQTANPAPITQIGFFAGQLESHSFTVDDVTVSVFYEEEVPEVVHRALGNQVRRLIESAHAVTGESLPFKALNVIHTNDLRWDIAPFGPGFAYVNTSNDDVNGQLLRAIAHQYVGARIRSASIDDNHHILALKAVLAHRIARQASLSDYKLNEEYIKAWESTVWTSLSPATWNIALQLTNPRSRELVDDAIQLYLSDVESSFSQLVGLDAGVYTWQEMSASAGIETPSTVIEIRSANLPVVEQYTVIYDFDELNGRYEFELVPHLTYPQRYLSLTIRQFTDGTVNDLAVLASNVGDRLHLSTGGFVENMYLYNDDPLLEFTEIKPAAFWLYQLRRDGDAERRIESAEGFGRVRNDPDVQLILQDLIRNEPDPRVKAKLVTSLSQIVGDAFGTNRRFMDLLSSESKEVRFAALYALRNYTSNEAVQQQVFRIISQSQDIDYVNLAIEVYKEIVEEREFYSVARSLLHEDREDLNFTQTIIPLIVQTNQGRIFAPNLMDYLDAQYAFSLRKTTFEALFPLDIDPEYWAEILPDLLADSDPRMRYMALSMVAALSGSHRDEVLQQRLYNEYDVRVLRRLQTMVP
jgi:hypothetical protein